MEFLKLLEGLRTPVLDHVMSVITQLGGETIFMLAAMVAYWCYDKAFGYYMMSVGFTGTALNQFLKLVCRIPRPWVRDGGFTIVESARAEATGYSFPSGHTQNAVTIFGTAARWMHGAAVRWTAPVSYTHLDVYKRQRLSSCEPDGGRPLCAAISKIRFHYIRGKTIWQSVKYAFLPQILSQTAMHGQTNDETPHRSQTGHIKFTLGYVSFSVVRPCG